MDVVVELLRRSPELRRAVLPHHLPNDTRGLQFGATLARCLRLGQLRLVKNGVFHRLMSGPKLSHSARRHNHGRSSYLWTRCARPNHDDSYLFWSPSWMCRRQLPKRVRSCLRCCLLCCQDALHGSPRVWSRRTPAGWRQVSRPPVAGEWQRPTILEGVGRLSSLGHLEVEAVPAAELRQLPAIPSLRTLMLQASRKSPAVCQDRPCVAVDACGRGARVANHTQRISNRSLLADPSITMQRNTVACARFCSPACQTHNIMAWTCGPVCMVVVSGQELTIAKMFSTRHLSGMSGRVLAQIRQMRTTRTLHAAFCS